ncbi:hypothetical protein HPB49_001814 [Dermacentor silvarum]|uniref:Uncharacterized protein n=1 Tax=Dermacentor silvarum TaxID=543639 RepID=A0ACB8D257_DERSI|nr:hypothetical protein HPB49_001814 [Dermacentor silvarum]
MRTVNRVLQAAYYEGRISDAPRASRQRVTSEDEEPLNRDSSCDRSLPQRQRNKDEVGLGNVSLTTIKRRLHEAGIRSRVSAQKVMLDERHRNERLEFASAVESWCPNNWRAVVFTDEASFCTRWDQQRRVRRPHNCRYDYRYVLGARSSGRTTVHVWGAVSRTGLGPLHRFLGNMTSETYMDVLETVLIPHVLDGPFPDGLYWLQQDNAPIHTSKAMQQTLDNLAVTTRKWPARSPDLNILENV